MTYKVTMKIDRPGGYPMMRVVGKGIATEAEAEDFARALRDGPSVVHDNSKATYIVAKERARRTKNTRRIVSM